MQANFEASLHVLMFFICFLFLFYATPFTLLYAPLCDELDRTSTEFLLTTALFISRKTNKSNMKLGLNTCKTRIYNTKYRITEKVKTISHNHLQMICGEDEFKFIPQKIVKIHSTNTINNKQIIYRYDHTR